MKPELRFETRVIETAELGEPSSVPDLCGEHILQNDLELCMEEDEIRLGYGRRLNAYPYRQFSTYTGEVKEKETRTAVLENDFLKAVFLLEYGGRMWELWDKKKGKNLLYTNDVIQFRNLAVRNAWFSGGVEWNVGVIGHCPFTVEPLYVARTQTETGDPVLRMYEYERVRGVPYQMDFWLEEEGRFLNARMRIVNESDEEIPMYWWSNIAVPEHEGGRIVVPAQKAYTFRNGKVMKVDIPVVDGIDITDYQKIPRSVDYFFDIPAECPKYIANVDSTGYGLWHRSTHRLQSRKLFSWGHQRGSGHWQRFLTKNAGPYIEIQAGLGKTQYGCLPMAPHSTWEWMEQYGPVQLSCGTAQSTPESREHELTETLCSQQTAAWLERRQKETETMAVGKAELVAKGSGYGALAKRGESSSHLEFIATSETLKRWRLYFETGKLHKPDPSATPDEFLIDRKNLQELIATLEKENSGNWYAFYQAGVGCFSMEDSLARQREEGYGEAKRYFLKSWELEKNPWACHGLACVELLMGENAEAVQWMERGLSWKKQDLSYLKEGFKILMQCGAFEKICACYKELDPAMQQVGRLRFYYISSLHQLGCDEEAYRLMEENGGLLMEDIREGEDSLGQLWSQLHESVCKESGEIPEMYCFQAV